MNTGYLKENEHISSVELSQNLKIGVEAFILKEGRLLLGKRKNAAGAGSWGLPGGHKEANEGLVPCLTRELNEELGSVITESQLVTVCYQARPETGTFQYIHFGFLVHIDTEIDLKNPIESNKCEEWKFYDVKHLPEGIFWAHKVEINAFLQGVAYTEDYGERNS